MATSQSQILNKILQTKDFSIITSNNLSEDYFFNYRAEFRYIKSHYDAYRVVPDELTFKTAFPDFDLYRVGEPDSYLLEQLITDYNQSYLARQFNQIRELLQSDKVQEASKLYLDSVANFHPGPAIQSVDLIADTSRYQRFIDRCNTPGQGYLKTGFKELDNLIGGIDRENENMVIVARTGLGKCLAKGTQVLMADGTTKTVEDVKIGDEVQSYNQTNKVLDLHNGVSSGFKIIPTYGEPFIVSSNHILTLYDISGAHDLNDARRLIDITVEDYLALSMPEKRLLKLFRPAVDYPEKQQDIDPYFLGLWLGGEVSADNTRIYVSYQDRFEKLNLRSDNKYIPLQYLTGSREQRLKLLAGLLDASGQYHKSRNLPKSASVGFFTFASKVKELSDNVAQLCRGLGFKVCIRRSSVGKINNSGIEYKINIYGNLSEIPTKMKALETESDSLTVGFTIEPVSYVEYYGFMCDGDSRYLLADNTLTHNTWTLLKMATEAVKAGLNVGMYSGEMSLDKVGYRFDTLMGNIDNKALMRGLCDVTPNYKAYSENLKYTANGGHFRVVTPAEIAGPATVDALRAFIERDKLDILFIDQYSLLEDTSHARTEFERVANISKAIKNLQVRTKIPIISVAQQNRTKSDAEDKTPDTTQIALSDRIGQDATCVLMLAREDDNLSIYVTKARDGGEGNKLTYNCDFNYGIFNYIPQGQDGQTSEEEFTEMAHSYEPDSQCPF